MKKRIRIYIAGTALAVCLVMSGCGKQEGAVSVKETVAGPEAAESMEGTSQAGGKDLDQKTAGAEEPDFENLADLKKATLQVTKDGETREETAANKADLEQLSLELFQAQRAETDSGDWTGRLTLETEDQKFILDVLFDKGWFLRSEGGYVYQLPADSEEVVWNMFSTLEGWVTYGSQVRIEMNEENVTPDTDELLLTLYNETGGPIEYIASPIIYRQMEDGSYNQVESIGGFCGFVSHLDGSETLVKLPWKGMFEANEPGIYKVEIQAMKEEKRWEISDTFHLEN